MKISVVKTFFYYYFACFSADEVLLKPTGAQLTVDFLEERSFSVPVLVLRRDGLGMSMPPASFSVSDIEHCIGKCCIHCFLLISDKLSDHFKKCC